MYMGSRVLAPAQDRGSVTTRTKPRALPQPPFEKKRGVFEHLEHLECSRLITLARSALTARLLVWNSYCVLEYVNEALPIHYSVRY